MTERALTYESDFAEYLTRIDAGEKVEVADDLFDYFLEVLPPATWRRELPMPDGRLQRCMFGFAEGMELLTGFWKENGKLYAQRSTVMNPHW